MRHPSLFRRATAEALGTGLLVATVVGSGIMAEALSSGNSALALLGNTIPTGAILVVLILAIGPVSGAHFNPAVSAMMAWTGVLSAREVAAYCLAQIAGGGLGTITAHAMFDLDLLQFSEKARTGPGLWLAEFVATFGLLLTIQSVARSRIEAIPVAVGLYITAAYWFTASTSFANPAVTIARAFSDTFAGIAPAHVPAFIVAQFAGAGAGTAAAAWLRQADRDNAPMR